MKRSVVVLLLVVALLANGVAHRFAMAAMLPLATVAGVGDQGAGSGRDGAERQARATGKSAGAAVRASSRCRPYTGGPAMPRSACTSDHSLPAGDIAVRTRQIPARFAVAQVRMPPGRGSPHPFHPPRVSS
ncbi:hypothetical protein [Rhodobium gokarnense]|uniref:Uncharacterized protein n=1 Tax=Rhodobium gokarnense TaxID=364296 RepID=A0ABT3HG62_9HYPH|nr:hypothetical protein [Rhodobium gokarnense]MCW2309393.1 hypothetical protein [Rhodobium gokarnense]